MTMTVMKRRSFQIETEQAHYGYWNQATLLLNTLSAIGKWIGVTCGHNAMKMSGIIKLNRGTIILRRQIPKMYNRGILFSPQIKRKHMTEMKTGKNIINSCLPGMAPSNQNIVKTWKEKFPFHTLFSSSRLKKIFIMTALHKVTLFVFRRILKAKICLMLTRKAWNKDKVTDTRNKECEAHSELLRSQEYLHHSLFQRETRSSRRSKNVPLSSTWDTIPK